MMKRFVLSVLLSSNSIGIRLRSGYHLLFFFLLALGLTIGSCSKDEDEVEPEDTEVAGRIPGFGEAGGTPQGEPFALPSGVRLDGEILGKYCDTTLSRGSGYYVNVCVGLINDTDQDITLVLPAGLLLIAQDTSYQNGLLLQGTTIIVKKKAITRCTLYTFCGNVHRSSSSSNVYTLGVITNSRLIGELITLLQGKRINAEDYGDDEEAYDDAVSTVQSALWSITDDDGLSDGDKSDIGSLPDK